MVDEIKKEEVKEEKKGLFAKAKDAILPDPEEQAAIISTMVRITVLALSLIHISEPTRLGMISYAVFCLKKKK